MAGLRRSSKTLGKKVRENDEEESGDDEAINHQVTILIPADELFTGGTDQLHKQQATAQNL